MPTKKKPAKPTFRMVPALTPVAAPARLDDGEFEAIVKTVVGEWLAWSHDELIAYDDEVFRNEYEEFDGEV